MGGKLGRCFRDVAQPQVQIEFVTTPHLSSTTAAATSARASSNPEGIVSDPNGNAVTSISDLQTSLAGTIENDYDMALSSILEENIDDVVDQIFLLCQAGLLSTLHYVTQHYSASVLSKWPRDSHHSRTASDAAITLMRETILLRLLSARRRCIYQPLTLLSQSTQLASSPTAASVVLTTGSPSSDDGSQLTQHTIVVTTDLTPLQIAIVYDHVPIAEYILRLLNDISNANSVNPCGYSAQDVLCAPDPTYGMTALHLAVYLGHDRCLTLLLNHAEHTCCKRSFWNAITLEGKTTLHLALERSPIETLEILLAPELISYWDLRIHDISSDGYTVLHQAAARMNDRIMRLLLQFVAIVSSERLAQQPPRKEHDRRIHRRGFQQELYRAMNKRGETAEDMLERAVSEATSMLARLQKRQSHPSNDHIARIDASVYGNNVANTSQRRELIERSRDHYYAQVVAHLQYAYDTDIHEDETGSKTAFREKAAAEEAIELLPELLLPFNAPISTARKSAMLELQSQVDHDRNADRDVRPSSMKQFRRPNDLTHPDNESIDPRKHPPEQERQLQHETWYQEPEQAEAFWLQRLDAALSCLTVLQEYTSSCPSERHIHPSDLIEKRQRQHQRFRRKRDGCGTFSEACFVPESSDVQSLVLKDDVSSVVEDCHNQLYPSESVEDAEAMVVAELLVDGSRRRRHSSSASADDTAVISSFGGHTHSSSCSDSDDNSSGRWTKDERDTIAVCHDGQKQSASRSRWLSKPGGIHTVDAESYSDGDECQDEDTGEEEDTEGGADRSGRLSSLGQLEDLAACSWSPENERRYHRVFDRHYRHHRQHYQHVQRNTTGLTTTRSQHKTLK